MRILVQSGAQLISVQGRARARNPHHRPLARLVLPGNQLVLARSALSRPRRALSATASARVMDRDYAWSASRTALSAASKPIFECVLSQKGLVVEAPQRHRTMPSPSGSSYSLPSASITVTGPVTL